jgi:glycosyltransferase involved in cell wall biosynthesis
VSYQVPEFGPFKIAMVAASPFPYPQGSQVLIQQLAVALQCREHQVRLVTYHCGVGQPSQEIKVHRIRAAPGLNAIRAGPSWQKPFLDLLLARKLLQVVRNWQPDVMHAHNFEGLLTALFVRRLTGVPVLYHVHNAMGLELHTYFRHRLGRWAGGVVGRWVDANLPRRANYCIVLNKAAVGYFRQRGVEQLRAIPPGIDFEPGDATQARQYLGSGPLVLYAGNLDHYQDLDLLLRAFQKVIAVRPDAQLVFSTNAEPAEWQAQTRALGIDGQTVFVRASDFSTVRDLLAAADVSVCPRQVCRRHGDRRFGRVGLWAAPPGEWMDSGRWRRGRHGRGHRYPVERSRPGSSLGTKSSVHSPAQVYLGASGRRHRRGIRPSHGIEQRTQADKRLDNSCSLGRY